MDATADRDHEPRVRVVRDEKWGNISAMWAGLGFFLFFFGIFVGLPAYDTWQTQSTKRSIVRACEGRPDIVVCVQTTKEALK